jgi:eukaryotic-like serine/threonine-protein kinase
MDTLSYDPVPARNTNAVLGESYIIGRRIGRGAMGEVYEAQHVRLPGKFAVKLLLPELQGNQEAFARFCREAEIMSQLRHPNIVQIFDFNVAPDARPYFVMEHLEGRDLEARLQAGPLTLPAVTRIVDAVGSALALAHAHGVVHRDLKPANIFLATVDGQTDELVKVLDFGISKVRAAAAQISHAVDLLGTPSYMSPEQARGQANAIDGRTDQFALGAIAYRMLTGTEPFHGDDTASVLYQVVHEDPAPLSMFLPPEWDAGPLQVVLNRALAKQPRDRFGGMMELARAFEDAAERTIGTTAVPRRQAIAAPRLDDAAIDPPPPVRTPEPLVLRPARQPPTPEPLVLPPTRRPPISPPSAPRMIDWELPSGVDKVPVTHVRGAVLGLLFLGLAGTLIATGWYRKLPTAAAHVRQKIHQWTRPSGPASAPPAAPEAPATSPEAAAREGLPTPTPTTPAAAAPEAAANEAAAAAPRPAASPPTPAPAQASQAPAAEKQRPPQRRAARRQSERRASQGVAAPPPPEVQPQSQSQSQPQPRPRETPVESAPPANPSLDGRAFEIAPPTPMEPRRRDLAPAPANDDTLPMSP